jgi:monofunctional biosynthetic peptidoglycan transglycosylase
MLFALAAVAVMTWWYHPGVDLNGWREGPPSRRWAAWLRQEARWAEEGSHRPIEHRYLPLARISPELQLAVLVSEDINFFGHGPVDLREIWEVLSERKPGERLRGASTISQQLARNLFLSPERTFWRKLKELRLAWWLERRLGKRRVFELYLNVVEFGPGVFGAEAASLRYLGVSSHELDANQAAALAAAIPAPGRDNPATATERWEFRRGIIASRMTKAGWLRNLLTVWATDKAR